MTINSDIVNWKVLAGLGLTLVMFCALGWFTLEDLIDVICDILTDD